LQRNFSSKIHKYLKSIISHKQTARKSQRQRKS